MERWYVVQTKNGQEDLAVRQLQNQNFVTFHPTFVQPTLNRKLKTIERKVKSLFPSYIFVKFDYTVECKWAKIDNTRGVIGLVGQSDDYISPLPIGCVEDLLSKVTEEGHLPLLSSVSTFVNYKKDTEFKVKDEIFAGKVGKYSSSEGDRINLLFTLLSKKVIVSLPISSVFEVETTIEGDGGSVSKENP